MGVFGPATGAARSWTPHLDRPFCVFPLLGLQSFDWKLTELRHFFSVFEWLWYTIDSSVKIIHFWVNQNDSHFQKISVLDTESDSKNESSHFQSLWLSPFFVNLAVCGVVSGLQASSIRILQACYDASGLKVQMYIIFSEWFEYPKDQIWWISGVF